MKINWKVRLRNKTWLASVLALIVSFVYDLLAMVEFVPPLSEDWLLSLMQTLLTLLTALGVVIDPTTDGAADSAPAIPADERGLLRRGDRGEAVRVLQRCLRSAGYDLTIDGVFGRITLECVKSFQGTHGLTRDGIVGPLTWAALEEACR